MLHPFGFQVMPRGHIMRYLHTMLRVRNLDQALDFYCNKLGLKEARRRVDEKNRYTLVFLAAPEDEGRRHHQSAAARRGYGLRALPRQAFDRALAERRPAAAQGTLELDAEHRE